MYTYLEGCLFARLLFQVSNSFLQVNQVCLQVVNVDDSNADHHKHEDKYKKDGEEHADSTVISSLLFHVVVLHVNFCVGWFLHFVFFGMQLRHQISL